MLSGPVTHPNQRVRLDILREETWILYLLRPGTVKNPIYHNSELKLKDEKLAGFISFDESL